MFQFASLKQKLFTAVAIVALSAGSFVATNAIAQDADVQPVDIPEQFPNIKNQAEMGDFIRKYLMENPEVIIEAVESYSQKQRMEQQAEASDKIVENKGWLYENDMHPDAGKDDASVTIVEFFDYNCGYCKRALSDVMTVLGEDNDLRVVFIELPILGEASTEAAKWAMAAKKQDLYLEFHVALMEHQGRLNDAQLANIAGKVGLDVDQLRQDKDSDEVMRYLNGNIDKARELGITGTPAFVIGEQLARGYVGLDALRAGIKENRSQ
jgi:protein-disulfide isomerase